MRATVVIERLKCNDCEKKVITALKEFKGISNYDIDITTGTLSFNYKSHNAFEGLRFHLSKIGHHITEDLSFINTKNSNPD